MSEFQLKLRSPEDREKYYVEKILDLYSANHKLESDLAECREILKTIEWIKAVNFVNDLETKYCHCPGCKKMHDYGHEKDCKLNLMLTRLGGK